MDVSSKQQLLVVDSNVVKQVENDIISSVPTTTTPTTTTKKSLGLLAEVALTRHYAEEQQKLENSNTVTTSPKAKTISQYYTLKQIKKLSEKRLIATFAEYKREIKTKRCSYKCQMLPEQCQIKFESFGSVVQETIKRQIVQHLMEHVCNLESSFPDIKILSHKVKVRKLKQSQTQLKKKFDKKPQPSKSTIVVIKKEENVDSPKETKNLTINDRQPSSSNQTYSSDLQQSHQHQTMVTTNVIKSPQLSAPYKSEQTIFVDKLSTNTSNNESDKITVSDGVSLNFPIVKFVDQQALNILPINKVISPLVETGPINKPIINKESTIQLNNTSLETSSNDLATQAKLRALALDYIDDIRKKSSSAAKSITMLNGDKSIIYQCKICPDKQFTSTNGLIFHYKKHAGLKPYVCELCAATFTRQHSLNYHMLIHLNKSRFVCSECSRQFRHPSHFKEHIRRHTGETPFQCISCFQRFKTRNTYKRHLQTKHSQILTSKGSIIDQGVPIGATTAIAVANTGTKTSFTPKSQNKIKNETQCEPTVVVGNVAGNAPGVVGTPVVLKPRRKYGMRYLHKNIEAISKFETANQQFHQTTVPPPPQSTLIAAAEAMGAIAAQTAPGSNITIFSIPQMPAVHILDNGSTVSASNFSTKESNRTEYQQPSVPPGSITLVSYHSLMTDEKGATVLMPLQTTADHHLILSSGASRPTPDDRNLTELTTALPISTTTDSGGTATIYLAPHQDLTHHQPSSNYSVSISHPHQLQQQQQQQQNQPHHNDNFMRLLEAIEMTEVE